MVDSPAGSSWQRCSTATTPVWRRPHGQHSCSAAGVLAEGQRAMSQRAIWANTHKAHSRGCCLFLSAVPGAILVARSIACKPLGGGQLHTAQQRTYCWPRSEPSHSPCGWLSAADCRLTTLLMADSCLADPVLECGRQVAHLNQVLTPIGHTEVLEVQVAAAHGPSVAHHNWRMPTRRLSSSCLQQSGKQVALCRHMSSVLLWLA